MATLGEFLGSGANTTKLLLHLSGNSTDSSGNGNNGTDTAITYSQANGKFGQGAGFNGSSSKIVNSTAPVNSNNFTISLWYKITAFPTNPSSDEYAFIINQRTENGTKRTFQILLDSYLGNHITFTVFDTSNASINGQGTPTLSTGVWYHFALVVTGQSNIKTYHNGNEYYSVAMTNNPQLTAENMKMGTTGWAPEDYYYNGSIDEVIIENRAWTASEIKKYYTNAKGRFHL